MSLSLGRVMDGCGIRILPTSKGVSHPGFFKMVALTYCLPGWSALCDLILAGYPVLFLWKVRLDMRVKIGICGLMGLGVM